MLFQQGALGELSPTMQEDVMARSNQNLLQMVNTLLEVYRFEAGRKIWSSYQLIYKSCSSVAKELSPWLRKTDCHYSWILEHEALRKAMGDRLELHRLFTNLVGNAIKFTDAGSHPPEAYFCPSDDSHEWTIWLLHCDWGRRQAQASRSKNKPPCLKDFEGSHKCSGSGLGLYLSRRMKSRHHTGQLKLAR